MPELTEREAIALSMNNMDKVPLDTNQDGSISRSSFTNYINCLQFDSYLRGRVRFNSFDGRITFTGFYWDARPHPVRDTDLSNLRFFLDRVYGLSNKNSVTDALTKVAFDNVFHPVTEYLNSLAWDGVPRIHELLPRYLGAERSEYTTAVTKLLLYGAIQRVVNPGCKFDYCVILADTMQGSGKSTLCRFLALEDDWYTDSVGDLKDSKAVFETMRGKWVIELGEMLAVRRASDVETIKAFISRQAQDYRQPYGTFSETHPRQCIFIGTTNRPYFLPEDKTGNRRFIPVRCDGRKAEIHPLANEAETREFVRQCYAEAIVTGKAEGYPLTLDRKYSEELETIQSEATPEDTRVGLIQAYLDNHEATTIVCSRLIWDAIFAGENNREPKKFELDDIADIMNLNISGWKKYTGKTGGNKAAKFRFTLYGTQRAWIRDGALERGDLTDKIYPTTGDYPFIDRGRYKQRATNDAGWSSEKIARGGEAGNKPGNTDGNKSEDDGFSSVTDEEKLPF